jgi:hypothetical protein
VLDAGPAASGWDEDQCWTLARITEVIRGRFRVDPPTFGGDPLSPGYSASLTSSR